MICASAGILGGKLHAGLRSAETLTAAPLMPFCLPLSNFTNFIKRICLYIVCSSILLRSFSSSGTSSKSMQFALLWAGTLPNLSVLWQLWHMYIEPLTLEILYFSSKTRFLILVLMLQYFSIGNFWTPFSHNSLWQDVQI